MLVEVSHQNSELNLRSLVNLIEKSNERISICRDGREIAEIVPVGKPLPSEALLSAAGQNVSAEFKTFGETLLGL